MALACGGMGTAIGGLVSPAHATPKRSGHPRSTCMPTSCPLVAVSKRVLAEELSRKGERRCIASRRMVCRASADSAGVAAPISPTVTEDEGKEEPKPIVHIDQDSDANATIVEISFGNRLGALLDTIKALQDLGLNVVKGVVTTEGPGMRRKKFLVTRLDNKKVEDPQMLEAIRLTIINNLLQYHPESSEQLAMGVAFGRTPPKKELDVDVATHITVTKDGPRSLLSVETADRPGLLLDILNVICDISIYVESAEIDTEGLVAKDKFYVTYHGDALNTNMEQVLTNALQYHLRKPETEEDSY